ncbi:MAG: hydrogenase [Candidatus Aenigmarchaeota archaeon]|nr:hydrogenase [Candidatus Aenigmarchaeota archaeon]
MTGMIFTPAGYWNPIVWVAVVIIASVIVFMLRSTGRKTFKNGAQQIPFYSGNEAPRGHIKASNMYWGFFESLEKYYIWLRKMHTGIINDYVYFLVIVIVILMAALALGGLL